MALRIIVETQNCGAAANISGARPQISHRTFVVEAPEVEKFMRESRDSYTDRQVIGVELETDRRDGQPDF